MRELLSKFLTNEAVNDPRYYVFSGDHGYALFDALRATRPGQFINAGVSEQAMVGYAAGFAKSGLKPVVYGLAAFVPMRVLEFIKIDICYENLAVIFLGDGAGLVYNTLGASHQCAEDIAALRALPNIRIYSPADKFELDFCLQDAARQKCPTYIRVGKSDKPEVHAKAIRFDGTELLCIRNSPSETAIVATGSMVSTAVDIAKIFGMSVYSAPILTGLNADKVFRQLRLHKSVVTLEEHSISGGLGSILAEILGEGENPKPSIFRMGIKNRFTQKCGSYEYAVKEHGLDIDSLVASFRRHSLLPMGGGSPIVD